MGEYASQMGFNVGDFVRFIDDDAAGRALFPPVGTIGEVVGFSGSDLLVKWPKESISDNGYRDLDWLYCRWNRVENTNGHTAFDTDGIDNMFRDLIGGE